MKRVTYITTGSAASGAYTDTVELADGYANGSGDGDRLLRVSWWTSYNDGTVSAVTCEHDSAADFSGVADLWAVAAGDIASASDQSRIFYTWNAYNRVKYTYAVGASTRDDGVRLVFEYDVYGLPNWDRVKVCRWEDVEAMQANMTDPTLDFQAVWNNHERLAKRHIGNKLRERGINPHRVFTDGHATTPVIEGLETAGAALTLWYVLHGFARKSDRMVDDMDSLWSIFNTDFEAAATGGLAMADDDLNTEPSEADALPKPARIQW